MNNVIPIDQKTPKEHGKRMEDCSDPLNKVLVKSNVHLAFSGLNDVESYSNETVIVQIVGHWSDMELFALINRNGWIRLYTDRKSLRTWLIRNNYEVPEKLEEES